MIRKASDVVPEVFDGFKGGKGKLEMLKFMKREDMYDKGNFFSIGTLEPGAAVGYHGHVGEFETYYILEGKALANDNGTESIIGPGDVFVCNDGCSHGLANAGDTDLRYIAIILNT